MRTTITLVFLILTFLNILVYGLNSEDEIGKERKIQVQPSHKDAQDEVPEMSKYLRKLENLETKLTQFFLQEKGFERIGTMIIVNNGHIQESGSGLVNKSDLKTNCSSGNLNVFHRSSGTVNDTMKHLEDVVQDLESRIRNLAVNSGNSNLELKICFPRDCSEVQSKKSGVYLIEPRNSNESFEVYCDMETDGGGWTVFQNRFDGSVDFYKGWEEYKNGFGKTDGEYWLGLEKLHKLTAVQSNELYILLEDFDKTQKYARFSSFFIDTESEGYPLKTLGAYSGTAGDSMRIQVGYKFTTLDKDQDNSDGNCAVIFTGAWWYKACHLSNLNGQYLRGDVVVDNRAKGMCWDKFRGHDYSLKGSKMMIRPTKIK